MTISDVLLERYLSDDLPPEARNRVSAALASDPALQSRLAVLAQERDAFLRSDPPAQFAHRVATIVAVRKPARPSWQRWLLPLGTALAMSLVGLNLLRLYRTDAYLAGKELAAESPEQTGANPPPAWKPSQEPVQEPVVNEEVEAAAEGSADKGAIGQALSAPAAQRVADGGGAESNKAKKLAFGEPSPKRAAKEASEEAAKAALPDNKREEERDALADANVHPVERPAAEAKRDPAKPAVGVAQGARVAADEAPREAKQAPSPSVPPAPAFAAPPAEASPAPRSPPAAQPPVAPPHPDATAGPVATPAKVAKRAGDASSSARGESGVGSSRADDDGTSSERRFAAPAMQAPSVHADRSRAKAESKDAFDDALAGGKGGGGLSGGLAEDAQPAPRPFAATFDFGSNGASVTATPIGAVTRRFARSTSASVRVSIPEPNRSLTVLAFDGVSLSALSTLRPRVGSLLLPALSFDRSQNVFVVLHQQPLDLPAIEKALRAKQRPAFGAPALQLNVIVQK